MINRKLVEYQAAGGVVVHRNRFLLLHKVKLNEWRLPKGHIEPGETPEIAALREVAEEGGWTGLEIIASLGSNINEFNHPTFPERLRREQFYFLMQPKGEEPIPFERDEKDQARFRPAWLSPEKALRAITFPDEKQFLEKAVEIMRGNPR